MGRRVGSGGRNVAPAGNARPHRTSGSTLRVGKNRGEEDARPDLSPASRLLGVDVATAGSAAVRCDRRRC
jgi:hypothetical protein